MTETDYADTAYLIAEFSKLHPDALVMTDHEEDEAIHVAIERDGDIVAAYTCTIGSDDDGYVFVPNSPWADIDTVRLPLMPEA